MFKCNEFDSEVIKLSDLIIAYNNTSYSWIELFNMLYPYFDFDDYNKALTNVVSYITSLGYDILDNPFRLIKFKN